MFLNKNCHSHFSEYLRRMRKVTRVYWRMKKPSGEMFMKMASLMSLILAPALALAQNVPSSRVVCDENLALQIQMMREGKLDPVTRETVKNKLMVLMNEQLSLGELLRQTQSLLDIYKTEQRRIDPRDTFAYVNANGRIEGAAKASTMVADEIISRAQCVKAALP